MVYSYIDNKNVLKIEYYVPEKLEIYDELVVKKETDRKCGLFPKNDIGQVVERVEIR